MKLLGHGSRMVSLLSVHWWGAAIGFRTKDIGMVSTCQTLQLASIAGIRRDSGRKWKRKRRWKGKLGLGKQLANLSVGYGVEESFWRGRLIRRLSWPDFIIRNPLVSFVRSFIIIININIIIIR